MTRTLLLLLLTTLSLSTAQAAPATTNTSPAAPPPHNPALDEKLIALVRSPSTDKLGDHASDADKVTQLLDQGADPNTKSGGTPVLIWALNFGNDGAALALINHGADFVTATDGRMSAVELASCIYYCPDALEAMLKKGAPPPGLPVQKALDALFTAGPPAAGKMNYLHDRPWTEADYQAWILRQSRVIDLLLAAGANLNGAPGVTPPLIHAIRSGHLEAARDLLRHGARLDVHAPNGDTPFTTAQTWHPEFLPDLAAAQKNAHQARAESAAIPQTLDAPPGGPTSHMSDTDLESEINVFILDSDKAGLKKLLDRGVNPDPLPPDANSLTTVNLAVSQNQPELLELLLSHGAYPDPHLQAGGTPLIRAVSAGDAKCVQILLNHGANPRLESNGSTPLALAKYQYDRGLNREMYPIFVKFLKLSTKP